VAAAVAILQPVAAEPINIFSHRKDLAGIAAALRRMEPSATIVGPDENWERIVIEEKRSWFGKARKLVFKNAPQYYGGPDWPRQVQEMQGYFSRFPDVPASLTSCASLEAFNLRWPSSLSRTSI